MMIRKFELQRVIVIIMIQENCEDDNEERDADDQVITMNMEF